MFGRDLLEFGTCSFLSDVATVSEEMGASINTRGGWRCINLSRGLFFDNILSSWSIVAKPEAADTVSRG